MHNINMYNTDMYNTNMYNTNMYNTSSDSLSMYNINKDYLKIFINSLIKEYSEKLELIINQKKAYMDKLYEKEAVFQSLIKAKKNSSKHFSPNIKEYNIDEYIKDMDIIREKIDICNKEEKNIDFSILNFQEIKKVLDKDELPQLNIGLNILEIQEQDRQRIARDLHDSIVQNLTGLIHKCELCTRLVDMDPVRTRLELMTMSNTVKGVINEIREIIYNLKPMTLDDLGLITTIERYANQLMMHNDIKVSFKHNEEINHVKPVIKLSIFRIIQEACSNAIKHAEAKHIDIELIYKKNYINVSIKDNGKGFDTEYKNDDITPAYCGYGLSIMKERVYLLSGTMKIQSDINKGTIITIAVPIRKSEGEE